ncbi:MAG: SUMF1/EgtB/PvdO family nonheme iron enzyme [Acidobacteriota bacterium]|nr:SUMF1/EgtB/PvdO family nonheme iron enzyme [Acidobacteriota bacterium]
MLELLLSAAVGGTVEALAGKGLEGPLATRTETVRQKIGGQPAGVAGEAVRRAVNEARLEVRDEYFAGEDEHSREVVALLDHAPFAQEVTRRILLQGTPDFGRLRQHYLERNGEGASERWAALELPLDAFFEAIERHLAADPEFGAVVRDTQQLVRLSKLEGLTQIIAASSQNIEQLQRQVAVSGERTAEASEQGVDLLHVLVERAGVQGASLERIGALLTEVVRELAGEGAVKGAVNRLTAEETHMLRELRKECDRLPLAEEAESRDTTRRQSASLANVYVSLDTETSPDLEHVLRRLQVPEEERPKLIEAWAAHGSEDRAAGHRSDRESLVWPQEIDEDHPLHAWVESEHQWRAARRPVSALEALATEPQLVLLGDPGSGKSTFVNHLATLFSRAWLVQDEVWKQVLGRDFHEPLFPLRVVLRRWSASLVGEGGEEASRDTPQDRRGGAARKKLSAAEVRELAYRALESQTALSRQRLLERLDEPSTLVLFDGLDEVPEPEKAPGKKGRDADRRRLIIQAISALGTAHDGCKILVTCRVKPYQDPGYQLPDCPSYVLAGLDDERIRTFIHRWYEEIQRIGQLEPARATAARDRLLQELWQPGREVLVEMARTPLLLTMLAKVNAEDQLPKGREALYRKCVNQLLWEWDRVKSEDGELRSLGLLLAEAPVLIERDAFERVLRRQTFEVHGESGKQTADLPVAPLREKLAKLADDDWNWAQRVIELMQRRGGLLVEHEPGVFTFPHRSFQEYLAARWLVEQRASLGLRQLVEQQVWREVFLLAASYLGHAVGAPDVESLIHRLVSGKPPKKARHWQRILVAGLAWQELDSQSPGEGTGEELKERIPILLTQLMQHRDLPPAMRLEAGLALSDLGVLPEDLDEWVKIPADTLDYSFKIGKYPVTNAQYRRFVEAGGYDPEKEWWSEEAKSGILDFEERVGNSGWPQHPRFWSNRTYNRASLPVVGVSWYEARAYCAWWTGELRAAGELSEEEDIRLPTLAEWLRAAGGAEGQEYPWGKDFEAWRANTGESALGRPSPVSMSPGGVSAEEVWDLTANVWEWSLEKEEDRWPWLLGGAYYRDSDSSGTSARFRVPPGGGYDYVGFRCVCSPVSRADSES